MIFQQAEKSVRSILERHLSRNFIDTAALHLWAIRKIPLISFLGPRILEVSEERCVLEVPCNRRTRNHLNSLYFGALAIGADLACGLLAKKLIEVEADGRASLVFKDFQAKFLKRPEGATVFICENGPEIRQAVRRAVQTGERQQISTQVVATVPQLSGDEPVAEFQLTLSIKSLCEKESRSEDCRSG